MSLLPDDVEPGVLQPLGPGLSGPGGPPTWRERAVPAGRYRKPVDEPEVPLPTAHGQRECERATVAEEIRATVRDQSSWLWLELGESALEKVADWIMRGHGGAVPTGRCREPVDDERPEHLRPTTTDRGFDWLPPIPSQYGGHVRVYESSAASGPHVWLAAEAPVNLNEPDGPGHEVTNHLTAENAWKLAEQLMFLVRNHYQGDASPEASR